MATGESSDFFVDLFLAARELPADKRAAFLNDACCENTALRRKVEEHLELGSRVGELAGAPPPTWGDLIGAEPEAPAELAASVPAIGDRIAGFRVLSVLGEGGMGVVYEAEQERLGRVVALKLVRPGAGSDELVQRLKYEAQVLGLLKHSGIAQIYEAGAVGTDSGPRPFFAMEYVQGVPLDEYVRTWSLGAQRILELLAAVADAVQYAHQRGVIHRDLKPGNILVEDDGQPKVLDFGVARATNSDLQATSMHTRTGQLIGTLAYMSPEQASGDPAAIDTRSDVYALGVIGYELLCGRPPYELDGKAILEAARIIRDETPARPSEHRRELRGNVDLVLAKTLKKDPAERYGSAAELAADIRRHLSGEPILARPPSLLMRLVRWRARHRMLVASLATAVVVLVATAGWLTFRYRQMLIQQELDLAVVAHELDRRADDPDKAARSTVEDLSRLHAKLRGPQRSRVLRALARSASLRGDHDDARDLLREAGRSDDEDGAWRFLEMRACLAPGGDGAARQRGREILADLAAGRGDSAEKARALLDVSDALGVPIELRLPERTQCYAVCPVPPRQPSTLLLAIGSLLRDNELFRLGLSSPQALRRQHGKTLGANDLAPVELTPIELPRNIFRENGDTEDFASGIATMVAASDEPPDTPPAAWALYLEDSAVPGPNGAANDRVAILRVDVSGAVDVAYRLSGVQGATARRSSMVAVALPGALDDAPRPGLLLGNYHTDPSLWHFRRLAGDATKLEARHLWGRGHEDASGDGGWDVDAIAVLPRTVGDRSPRLLVHYGKWEAYRTVILERDPWLGRYAPIWERPLGFVQAASAIDFDLDGVPDGVFLASADDAFEPRVFGRDAPRGPRPGSYLLRTGESAPRLSFLAPPVPGTRVAFSRSGQVAGRAVCLAVHPAVGSSSELSWVEVHVFLRDGRVARMPLVGARVVQEACFCELDGDGSDELVVVGDAVRVYGIDAE